MKFNHQLLTLFNMKYRPCTHHYLILFSLLSTAIIVRLCCTFANNIGPCQLATLKPPLASTLATLVQKYAIRILIGYKYGYYIHIYVIYIQIGWPLWPEIWPHWPLAADMDLILWFDTKGGEDTFWVSFSFSLHSRPSSMYHRLRRLIVSRSCYCNFTIYSLEEVYGKDNLYILYTFHFITIHVMYKVFE